jgi:hypothetical protein
MVGESDYSRNPGISLKDSTIKLIDKYRVGTYYKNRSEYFQALADKDLYYSRIDYISELMSMLVLPMMGFFFFMVLAVLTSGLLFYFFMVFFGFFAVWLSILYNKRHGKKRSG